MTNLQETLGALEVTCHGSLSKQSSDCLKLLQAARALLPGSQAVEPMVLVYYSVPLQEVPKDLWPEGYEPGEWDLDLGQSSTKGSPVKAPLVPIPKAVEVSRGDLDPEALETLAVICDELRGFLGSPVVSWKDLKAALRETVRELSRLAFPEAVPPMILGSVLPGDPEGFYRSSRDI